MVAVAIVVMMAVPVLAVIGNASGETSDDVIVAINDADSFGGAGYHGGEGDSLAFGDEEAAAGFRAGEDMGIGYPVKPGAGEGFAGVERPRFALTSDASMRRDKPTPTRDESATVARVGSTARKVPSAPAQLEDRLELAQNHCVEDIVAPVETAAQPVSERPGVIVVTASGR